MLQGREDAEQRARVPGVSRGEPGSSLTPHSDLVGGAQEPWKVLVFRLWCLSLWGSQHT